MVNPYDPPTEADDLPAEGDSDAGVSLIWFAGTVVTLAFVVVSGYQVLAHLVDYGTVSSAALVSNLVPALADTAMASLVPIAIYSVMKSILGDTLAFRSTRRSLIFSGTLSVIYLGVVAVAAIRITSAYVWPIGSIVALPMTLLLIAFEKRVAGRSDRVSVQESVRRAKTASIFWFSAVCFLSLATITVASTPEWDGIQIRFGIGFSALAAAIATAVYGTINSIVKRETMPTVVSRCAAAATYLGVLLLLAVVFRQQKGLATWVPVLSLFVVIPLIGGLASVIVDRLISRGGSMLKRSPSTSGYVTVATRQTDYMTEK